MALNVSAGPGIQVGDGAKVNQRRSVVRSDLESSGTEAEATWHLQTLAGYKAARDFFARPFKREGLPVLPRQRS